MRKLYLANYGDLKWFLERVEFFVTYFLYIVVLNSTYENIFLSFNSSVFIIQIILTTNGQTSRIWGS